MKKFSKCIFFAEDFKLFAKFDQIQTHTFGEKLGSKSRLGVVYQTAGYFLLFDGGKQDRCDISWTLALPNH